MPAAVRIAHADDAASARVEHLEARGAIELDGLDVAIGPDGNVYVTDTGNKRVLVFTPDGEPVGDWHLEHRDRLQRLYVDSLMELGDRLTAEERHARAADAYRRVLARDELHEDALLALDADDPLPAVGERERQRQAHAPEACDVESEPEEVKRTRSSPSMSPQARSSEENARRSPNSTP